jgi:hypothetical protein
LPNLSALAAIVIIAGVITVVGVSRRATATARVARHDFGGGRRFVFRGS